MRIKRTAVVFTVMMLLFLMIYLILFARASYPKRDIIYYNDLLHKVEKEISNGKNIQDLEKKYGCSIVYSKRIDDPVLSQLYMNEALVLDLTVDGEYVGKVGWLDVSEKRHEFGKSFFQASIIIWAGTLILGYVLFFFIWSSYVRPTGELKHFSQEIAKGNLDTQLPMRKNNLFGSFTEAFDIMREELRDSEKRKMEAEIARKELVTSLSHDVKTPVAVIDATCEVLDVKLRRRLQKLEDSGASSEEEIKEIEDSLEKIGTISSKAQTISSLMTDLMRSNLEDSEKAQVVPQEEFSSVIEDYFIRIRNFGRIVLTNHIPRCLVYMDRRRMEQVIDNVVGNSVKYAGTEIRVSFDEVNDMLMPAGTTGDFIRVTIKDSGPGVSEEDLPLIAQKYYRGSNAKEKGGYGMGLYLVKDYMKKQGGDMEYYNDHGFTVVLMLKKV